MTTQPLADQDVRALLIAVGAPTSIGTTDHARSFEELELDSLARTEIASRVKDRFGIDVEDDLTPDLTPVDMQRLVNDRCAAAAA